VNGFFGAAGSHLFEACSLCHQQLINKGAIVSNFVCFGLLVKLPTAMFHQHNCLCASQKKAHDESN